MQRAVTGSLSLLFLLSVIRAASAQDAPPKPTASPRANTPQQAQPQGPPPCPAIGVQGPTHQIRDGQRVVFSANIAGGDPKVSPTIVWNTSGGAIMQGHNTRRIEVDTTGAGATSEREVRADVWVGGYAPECTSQASGSVKIIPPASKFGEFGVVDDETLKRNLDALTKYLAQSPDNLLLIAYAGRNTERGFTQKWIKRIRDGIVTEIPPGRVAIADGGYREEPVFEFWIVPAGAEMPRPTPTLKRSDIVTPTTRPARTP